MSDRKKTIRSIVRAAVFACVIAAVVQELTKPREERTWTGVVAGFVPYDFRRPTIERYRSRWWNAQDDRLIVPQVFGVGWTINAHRLGRLVGVLPSG